MRFSKPAFLLTTAYLLSGCSAQLIEDAGTPVIPRSCGEPAKLFTTFLVHARTISWANRRDGASTVTIELVFENTAKWPLALSNSGNGIVYSVEYTLQGENGLISFPKETFGLAQETPLEEKRKPKPGQTDAHQPIKPEEAAEGKLVFEVPRGSYVLSIERKFEGKPVPGNRENHLSMCKIFPADFSSPRPAKSLGISGVY